MTNLAVAISKGTNNNQGAMGFKEEQKRQREKISAVLIQGALELSAEEGYASLSLRSVARKAGIAPTSFYRHFRDMDELGLAIVDDAKTALNQCLEQAAGAMHYAPPDKNAGPESQFKALDGVVHPFVETLVETVAENPDLFRVFFQEKTGSSRIIREAISLEMDNAANYLAGKLEELNVTACRKSHDCFLLARAMLLLAAGGVMEMLTREDAEAGDIAQSVISQCGLLLLGASVL